MQKEYQEVVLARIRELQLLNPYTLNDQGRTLQALGLILDRVNDLNTARDFFGDVEKFHRKFNVAYKGKPRALPDDMEVFRNKFLREELKEYEDATEHGDLAKQFDSLIDLIYVAMGNAHLHGFDFRTGWARVHEANMLKERAKNAGESKRGSAFDVVKPDGWKAPDLTDLCQS